jgi:hypothetical protein
MATASSDVVENCEVDLNYHLRRWRTRPAVAEADSVIVAVANIPLIAAVRCGSSTSPKAWPGRKFAIIREVVPALADGGVPTSWNSADQTAAGVNVTPRQAV